MKASSASEKTLPVGLCGVLRMSARARFAAAVHSSLSSTQPSLFFAQSDVFAMQPEQAGLVGIHFVKGL